MSVRVCLSVSQLAKTTCPQTSRNFLHVLTVAVARSSSDDNSIRYVLPVLWMTSWFHIAVNIVRGVGNNDVGAVLQQVVKISNVFAGAATLSDCRRMQWQQMAHRGRSVMSAIALMLLL